MRFLCATILLQAALASASSSTSVTYGDGSKNRKLALIGTDPNVDIVYDGPPPQCPSGSGRRFDAGKSLDPMCTDENNSWDLVWVLEIGEVKITSCPKDKILKVSGPVDAVPTTDDCRFMHNLASDLVTREQYKNKLSLEAQSAKGVEILCDWPAGLSMNYDVNFAEEWDYQRQVTVLFDSPGANVIMSKPVEDFLYDEFYQSLCFSLEEKYVMDAYDRMAAKLSLDGPCSGETEMHIGGPNMEDQYCQPVPKDASRNDVNWASGNCFGRCGRGCGAYEGAPQQFTNDCVDYDFCTRFLVNRQGGLDCFNEFLRTLDDTLWSGNCDEDSKMEEEPDCAPIPTAAPVLAPTPVEPINFRPVVVTYIQGGSCTDACAAAPGNWACSLDSLADQNFRFTTPNIYRESLYGLGVPCNSIDPASGLDDPTAAKFTINDNTCVPTTDPRDASTFSCDAIVEMNEIRFCTCYEG